jgi:hypothetical protein
VAIRESLLYSGHSVNGHGGHIAADLGRRIDRNFTPGMLASTMWNHAPTMVSALWHHGPRMLEQMNDRRIQWPRFDGREMSNLIAYLNAGARAK